MANILVLSYKPITNDNRVLNQIKALKKKNKVIVNALENFKYKHLFSF